MKEHGFGKDFRLRSNDDFKRVICQRRKSSDGLLTVYAAENDKGYARIGVSVGKHIGSAVVRNRIKRLIREAFRRAREEVPQGFDYVVIAGKRARQEASLEKIRESLICLSGNANKKTQIS